MVVSPLSISAIHRFVGRRHCNRPGIPGESWKRPSRRYLYPDRLNPRIMTPPATALPVELPQAFLGVAHSLTDKLWRDRLDARGAAKALAIVQQHQLPELL